MDERTDSFGYWLRRRRKALDLTQESLAKRVSCSRSAIRKIEADERRPSRQLADRLANKLVIAPHEREAFLAAARALRPADKIQLDSQPRETSAPGRATDAVLAESTGADNELSPLVGRSNELGLLRALVAHLTTGAGHVALITGEPGIGKSRLIRELTRYARTNGLAAISARCYEFERGMTYRLVIDIVTQALQRMTMVDLQKLPPVSLAEIAALVPSAIAGITVPGLSADFPEARRARLFAAILQLLEGYAGPGRQLILMVDDVQWADDASAQFLHYVGHQSAGLPLLVTYACRDEALDDERLSSLFDSLRRESHTRHLPLAPLQPEDAQALLQGFGDADLALRLYEETEGNAFFLTSMVHAVREGGIVDAAVGDLPLPETLRDSVRARITQLPAEVRPILDLAAVFGGRFNFDTLLAVSEESQARLVHAIELLVKRHILREDAEGDFYDFSHDKVREVAYREIGSARRMLLHRTVAETLEQITQSESHERDALLAEHYWRGHVWDRAFQRMLLAAESSQKLFAMRDALDWFDRAFELAQAHSDVVPESVLLELHEERGSARANAGQTQGAVDDIRVVIEAARARGDRVKVRDELIQLGMTYRRADDYVQATACLTQALEQSRDMNDERHAADTLYHLGTVAWSDGRNREAIDRHQEAVAICERLGLNDLVAVQAYHGRGEAHFNHLAPVAAISCYQRSVEIARDIGDKSYESENLMMIAWAYTGYMGIGDYESATKNFELALEIAKRADLQWHMGPILLGLDHVRACTGRYGEAWAGMMQTLQWLEGLNQTRYRLMACDLTGRLLLDLGLNEKAVEYFERGLALAHEHGIRFWRPQIEANLAIARMRLGDRDVSDALESALHQTRENFESTHMIRCLEGIIELALLCGDVDRCLAHVAELQSTAQAAGLKELSAQAQRWCGEALAAAGKSDAALAQLSLAAKAAEEIGRVRLAWDASVALAKISGRDGDRVRANALLARIENSLDDCELRAQLVAG